MLTDREWQDRYVVTSIKGKIWKRSEVQAGAMKLAMLLAGTSHPRPTVLESVKSVLNDDTFMRPIRGSVPARVTEDVAMEAFLRLTRAKP